MKGLYILGMIISLCLEHVFLQYLLTIVSLPNLIDRMFLQICIFGPPVT